jgi:hypothetical protein
VPNCASGSTSTVPNLGPHFCAFNRNPCRHRRRERDEAVDIAELVTRLVVRFEHAGAGAVIESDDDAAIRGHGLGEDPVQRKTHRSGPEFLRQSLALHLDMPAVKVDPPGQPLIGFPMLFASNFFVQTRSRKRSPRRLGQQLSLLRAKSVDLREVGFTGGHEPVAMRHQDRLDAALPAYIRSNGLEWNEQTSRCGRINAAGR